MQDWNTSTLSNTFFKKIDTTFNAGYGPVDNFTKMHLV